MLATKKIITLTIILSNCTNYIFGADATPKLWVSIAREATSQTQKFLTTDSLKQSARGAYELTGKLSPELLAAIRSHTNQKTMSAELATAWVLSSEPTLSPIFKPALVAIKPVFSPEIDAEELDYTNPA